MEGQMTLMDFVRGNDRIVEPIDREHAKPFVESIHYSRKLPSNVIYCFGLYENNQLIGVVSYGIPASPSLCKGIAGDENRDRVLELNRLAIKPEFNGGNRASYLVGHSLKMLPNRTFVVSYADTGWTHIGYVYQATNFLYTGATEERLETYCEGQHCRHAEKFKHLGLHQIRNSKHRYVYLVGDRRTKKEMRQALRYKVIDAYPKGDEVHYDTDNPKIAKPIRIVK